MACPLELEGTAASLQNIYFDKGDESMHGAWGWIDVEDAWIQDIDNKDTVHGGAQWKGERPTLTKLASGGYVSFTKFDFWIARGEE